MKKIICLLIVAVVVMFFVVPVSTIAKEEIKLRLSAPLPPGASPAIPVKWWAEEVEKRTNGRVKIEPYWAGSLVKTKETLDAVKSGLVDIGLVNAPHYPDKLPLINMQMPVFFSPSDPKVYIEVYKKMLKHPAVLNDIERYNVKFLFTVPSESKNIATKKQISKLEDMKGVKISTIGIYYPKAFKALGAVPVTVGAPRMYQSLQTGVIEGSAMGYGSIGSFKLYEVTKFALGAQLGAEIVGLPVINRDVWNKLPPDIQKVFMETANDAMEFNKKNLIKYTAAGVEKIKKSGGTISEMSWEDKVRWASLMGNYPAEWAKEMDGKGLPGTEVMNLFLDTCREMGHKFPREWKVN